MPLSAQVEQLQGTDASTFQAVLSDAIRKLRAAASESSDPVEAAYLSDLANRFQWLEEASNAGALPNFGAKSVNLILVRARFGENLARLAGDPRYPLTYLIGLFSLLDALLDQPLERALRAVGVAPIFREVLLGMTGADKTLTGIHALVRFYEAGEWEQVRQSAQGLGFTEGVVADAYVDATE